MKADKDKTLQQKLQCLKVSQRTTNYIFYHKPLVLYPQTLSNIPPSTGQNKCYGNILLYETSVICLQVGHFDSKHRCLVVAVIAFYCSIPSGTTVIILNCHTRYNSIAEIEVIYKSIYSAQNLAQMYAILRLVSTNYRHHLLYVLLHASSKDSLSGRLNRMLIFG